MRTDTLANNIIGMPKPAKRVRSTDTAGYAFSMVDTNGGTPPANHTESNNEPVITNKKLWIYQAVRERQLVSRLAYKYPISSTNE